MSPLPPSIKQPLSLLPDLTILFSPTTNPKPTLLPPTSSQPYYILQAPISFSPSFPYILSKTDLQTHFKEILKANSQPVVFIQGKDDDWLMEEKGIQEAIEQRNRFRRQVKGMCKVYYGTSQVTPLKIQKIAVTGNMLVHAFENISEGTFDWDNVLQIEAERYVRLALAEGLGKEELRRKLKGFENKMEMLVVYDEEIQVRQRLMAQEGKKKIEMAVHEDYIKQHFYGRVFENLGHVQNTHRLQEMLESLRRTYMLQKGDQDLIENLFQGAQLNLLNRLVKVLFDRIKESQQNNIIQQKEIEYLKQIQHNWEDEKVSWKESIDRMSQENRQLLENQQQMLIKERKIQENQKQKQIQNLQDLNEKLQYQSIDLKQIQKDYSEIQKQYESLQSDMYEQKQKFLKLSGEKTDFEILYRNAQEKQKIELQNIKSSSMEQINQKNDRIAQLNSKLEDLEDKFNSVLARESVIKTQNAKLNTENQKFKQNMIEQVISLKQEKLNQQSSISMQQIYQQEKQSLEEKISFMERKQEMNKKDIEVLKQELTLSQNQNKNLLQKIQTLQEKEIQHLSIIQDSKLKLIQSEEFYQYEIAQKTLGFEQKLQCIQKKSFIQDVVQQNSLQHDHTMISLRQSIQENNQYQESLINTIKSNELMEAQVNDNQKQKIYEQEKVISQQKAQIAEHNQELIKLRKKHLKYKDFKLLIKATSQFQCKYCKNNFVKDMLMQHQETCELKENSLRSSLVSLQSKSGNASPPQIMEFKPVIDKSTNIAYYHIVLHFNGMEFKLQKNLQQFVELRNNLLAVKSFRQPDSAKIFNIFDKNLLSTPNQSVEKFLKKYVQDLIRVQTVWKSEIFQNFIHNIEQQHPKVNYNKIIKQKMSQTMYNSDKNDTETLSKQNQNLKKLYLKQSPNRNQTSPQIESTKKSRHSASQRSPNSQKQL